MVPWNPPLDSTEGWQLDDDLLRSLDGLHLFLDGTYLPRHRREPSYGHKNALGWSGGLVGYHGWLALIERM